MWHELTRAARESGDLVLLGVIQEQHPDRCLLFKQWHQIEWPILHDPINSIPTRAVPVFIAIDEAGVVVDSNLRTNELEAFLDRPPATVESKKPSTVVGQTDEPNELTAAERIVWGAADGLTDVIEDLKQHTASNPEDGPAWFQLGVAHRMRMESEYAENGDFQFAVHAWDQALAIDPNHYIYRRRIQQYGPRLIKPYPFYDWIEQARAEITARGDEPVQLSVEPSGAEIASPQRTWIAGEPGSVGEGKDVTKEPDPEGRIIRDLASLVQIEVVVVPGQVKPGMAVRAHLQLTLSGNAHWNNEADPVALWVKEQAGVTPRVHQALAQQAKTPESKEVRRIELELMVAKDVADSQIEVPAYLLYYVCEETGGQCLYRRQDVNIPISLIQQQD